MNQAKTSNDLVELAVIGKARGLAGELFVRLHNPASDLLQRTQPWVLSDSEGADVFEIRSVKRTPDKKSLLVCFEGIAGREAAQALTGCVVCLPRAAFPEPADDEYYHSDLVGAEVVIAEEVVGRVTRVLEYPASVCLEVTCDDGAREVPFRPPWLIDVDVPGKRIVLAMVPWKQLDVERGA